MEDLRQALLAPAAISVLMIFGCADAMKTMVKIRYALKDDNGKPLFPHPYAPWEAVDPKHKEPADKVYRSFKMFENVKEWTFLSMPCMWIFAFFAGSLPYVTDTMVDASVVASGLLYLVATHWYVHGYIEAPEKRIKGFHWRMKAVQVWLFGSFVAVVWSGLQRIGLAVGK